jgi:hypothetical protein
MTYFVGLDVSLEETAICIVDDTGAIVREGKAATEPEDISGWLKTIDVTFIRVGLEAGPLSPWLCAAYLANGGALEHAQEMAAHESPRTTKLYDRTKERLTQDEVERIRL